MQKIRVSQNSFQFGEISDSAIMRTDSPVYAASAQSLKNMTVLSQGAVKKRSGLRYMAKDTGPDADVHLVPFVFDDNEQYIIAIGNGFVQPYFLNTDGETLNQIAKITADVDSAALPFDDTYIQEYTTAQYGDVLFVCHPLFAPRAITRTSLYGFEVSTFTFDERADGNVTYQPYSVFHAHATTLDPSATSGTGRTLTTSVDYFDTTGSQTGGNYLSSKHVGVKLRYHKSEIEITSVQSATQARGDIVDTLELRLSVLNPLRTIDGTATVEVTHILHGFEGGESIVVSDASAVGGITSSQLNGSRTIVEIVDENTYTFTAGGNSNVAEDGGGNVTISCHAPTDQWDEQSFSAVRGYPAAVTFHENRLCFGGTISEPDTIWMSKLGGFFNFDVGEAEDNDAINIVAATGDVNEIRYLKSNRDLQVFTLSDELYIPTYLNQAITPTNAQIRKQTPFGCEFVRPESIDGGTIFVEKGGRAIREYLYADSEDAYISTSISTLGEHLIKTPVDMAVVHSGFKSGESYAAVVMNDGSLALFSSNRSEKRAAWSSVEFDGDFKSVVAVHDRLFAYVTDSTGYHYLCEFSEDIGLDRWEYLNNTSNSVSTPNFSNGETVDVIGVTSGVQSYLGEFTVASGAIDTTGHSSYSKLYVGHKFDIQIDTNPVDQSLGNGPATGAIRGITNIVVNGKNMQSLTVNDRSATYGDPFTGNKEFRLLGYNRAPQVKITQSEPLPLQLNGLISELIV
jgi:hypothetical protein